MTAEDPRDLPTVLRLATGERWTIRLQGMGTAGYEWICTVEGRQDVITTGLSYLPPVEVPAPGSPPPGSSNIDVQLGVQAQHPGKVMLHLSLQRRWEAAAPLRQQDIQVVVS